MLQRVKVLDVKQLSFEQTKGILHNSVDLAVFFAAHALPG